MIDDKALLLVLRYLLIICLAVMAKATITGAVYSQQPNYHEYLKSKASGLSWANDQLFRAATSSYQLKEYRQSISLLNDADLQVDLPPRYWELFSLSLAKSNDWENAELAWQRSNQPVAWLDAASLFNANYDPYPIHMSYILPGSGMIYQGLYGPGLVSLLINGLLLYGIADSFAEQQYGLSFLLLFFEIPFYLGNVNATRAQAHNTAFSTVKAARESWIAEVETFINWRDEP